MVYDHNPMGKSNCRRWEKVIVVAHADWSSEVDEFMDGDVRLNCHYNNANNRCTNDYPYDMTMGFTWGARDADRFDGIHLCLGNIHRLVDDDGKSAMVPLTAGTIAHELMHHSDGDDSHAGKKTDPKDPKMDAETIGVAAEHLALTGDLDTARTVTRSQSGESYIVDMEYTVSNRNPHADSRLESTANFLRNGPSTTCLMVDGARADSEWTTALEGLGETSPSTMSASVPLFDPDIPIHTLDVLADCDDDHHEYDEDNNTSSYRLSTWTDLSISVDLAAVPVFHSSYLAYPFGYYDWFELTYEVVVTNLDSDTTSPTVDLVMVYDDMWAGSALALEHESQSVEPLGPNESQVYTFTVDVPANSTGTEPVGTTRLRWLADWGSDASHDRDRDNNTHSIDVNTDYWKPDYRVTNLGGASTGWNPEGSASSWAGGVTYGVVVANMGPVDAAKDSFLGVSGTNRVSPASAHIPVLSALESTTIPVILTYPSCGEDTYHLTADRRDSVREYDETNNTTSLTVGHSCPDWDKMGALSRGIDLPLAEELFYDWGTFHELVGQADAMQWKSSAEWVQSVLDQQGNGPFLPMDWQRTYVHTVATSGPWYLVVSEPVSSVVSTWGFTEGDSAFLVNGAVLQGAEEGEFLPNAGQLEDVWQVNW